MNVTPLSRVRSYFKQVRADIAHLFRLVESLNHRIVENDKHLEDAKKHFHSLDDASKQRDQGLETEIERLQTRNNELEHMVRNFKASARGTGKGNGPALSASKELFADNHDLDAFYLEFENHFRGSEEEIKQKQQKYIKVFKDSKADKKLPIVDLGCGRGEFLDLLHHNGLVPVGVDLNQSMVDRARETGYEAVQDDAISYLSKQKTGSLAGITGFHLAEHLPFDQLLVLIAEANRCLAKGGILLLETPNPENVYVGSFTFHYDPSHLKPLPPAIVQFSAKFKGFKEAEIMRVAPEMTEEEIKAATKNEKLQDALRRLYGPRDYALVAYK
jgi:SAM-dependent methyltransferase